MHTHYGYIYVRRIENLRSLLFQGDAGYQDMLDCVGSLATVRLDYEPLSPSLRKPYVFQYFPSLLQLLKVKPEEVLIESTGVIGHRIKKVQLQVFM